jgi:putative FmdB family regulatory protein
MPTYEYKCSKCEKPHTETRSMTEAQIKKQCDDCKQPLIRIYGISGVAFNGSGFYTTDKKQ